MEKKPQVILEVFSNGQWRPVDIERFSLKTIKELRKLPPGDATLVTDENRGDVFARLCKKAGNK